MSVKVMSQVFEGFPEGGSRLLVMLALADFARDDGSHIWPSVPTLAHKVRLKDRQVRYILKSLVDDGFLVVEKQGEGGNAMGTTHYSIRAEALVRPAETPAPDCTPDTEDRGADGALECSPSTPALECTPALQRVDPCTGVPQPLHPSAPNPSLTVMNHHHQRAAAGAREGGLFSPDGGGGGALRGDPQGAPPPAPPAGEAKTQASAQAPKPQAPGPTTPLDSDEHRRAVAIEAMIVAGIADAGTRERLADLPHITAAVVRAEARQAKARSAGPGALVAMIETASQRIEIENAKAPERDAGIFASRPASVADRTTAELSAQRVEASSVRCEWAETLGVLQRAGPEAVEAAKAALLDAQPHLRRMMEREDPLRHRMLGSLVAERLGNPTTEALRTQRAHEREAVVV